MAWLYNVEKVLGYLPSSRRAAMTAELPKVLTAPLAEPVHAVDLVRKHLEMTERVFRPIDEAMNGADDRCTISPWRRRVCWPGYTVHNIRHCSLDAWKVSDGHSVDASKL